jgi:hypothetical protein
MSNAEKPDLTQGRKDAEVFGNSIKSSAVPDRAPGDAAAATSRQSAGDRSESSGGASGEFVGEGKAVSALRSATAVQTVDVFKRRLYQRAVLRALRVYRCFIMLWRRQGGKSTTLAEGAHFEMMKIPGRLVTYASASLLLGREIIFKEAQIFQKALEHLKRVAAEANLDLQTADRGSGRLVKAPTIDDFAELFEAQRLEFRLYHDRTKFSRTQVIAPNPATARGWTGTVMLDEFAFIPDLRDLMEAVEPIVSTDPNFHLIMATTPPKDDAHYSYELTAPPIGMEFKVNPEGNWYTSDAGKKVHRVDIFDAYACGVKLYDLDSGKELTPEEHFQKADDKDAWRRNYKVEHVLGGTSACGLIQLDTAQRRGMKQCIFVAVDSEADLERAEDFLLSHLGEGAVGLGLDTATTEKEVSNPSALAVVEQNGVEFIVRLLLVWKTNDPEITRQYVNRIVAAVKLRRSAGPARRLCIDATNERFFATELRRELAAHVPVELVIGSETIQRPGMEEPMTMKQFLGGELVGELDDNHLTLPADRYVREDFRLVKKERGNFVCQPAPDGKHGDTFDATKLGLRALRSSGGAIVSMEGIHVGGNAARMARFRPARLGERPELVVHHGDTESTEVEA